MAELLGELKSSEVVVTRKERVVVDTFIEIAGYKFDMDDLVATLREIHAESDIVIENEKMVEFFKKYDIATKGNMRWFMRAEPLGNFEAFKDWVEELYANASVE